MIGQGSKNINSRGEFPSPCRRSLSPPISVWLSLSEIPVAVAPAACRCRLPL